MSIAQNFPEIKPSLNLDFANVKALDSRVTFARASTGAYYDGQTVAKAEENLIIRSQEFDNAYWTKQGLSITANSIAAPDGTTTADSFVANNAVNGASGVYINSPVVTTQSFSCFVKAGNKTQVVLATAGGTNNAWFNLSTGLVGTKHANITSTSISDVGGGWYRISLVRPWATGIIGLYFSDADNSLVCTGDGTTVSGYAWGIQLEDRSSLTAYTPTTTQPITNYIPVLQTASANVARFDHDPVTGESLGLLVEEQRTNLVTYSEQFDNAAWVKANATITANTIVAPDGMSTGDKIVEGTTASSTAQIYTTVGSSAVAYTWSVYAKAAERNFLVLNVFNASSTRVYFNLSTGAVGTVAAGVTANITAVGNGWYRCSLTRTTTADVTTQWQIGVATADNTPAYTGDGYSGIYIWGTQLEAGAFPTSYIPTVASQVTRAIDSASMTGANFSEWYRQDEGTLYAEFNAFGFTFRSASATDGTQNNVVSIFATPSSIDGIIYVGNSFQGIAGVSGTYFANQYYKQSLAYKLNDSVNAVDGAIGVVDTSCLIPLVDRLYIGQGRTGASQPSSGHIKKLSYYNKRLTNEQLQAITG